MSENQMAKPEAGRPDAMVWRRSELPPSLVERSLRVLVVDDEPGVRNALGRILRKAGMLPAVADGGAAALALLERESFDVAVLDVRMPGMTGFQLLTKIKEGQYPIEVIMMTAFADIATTVRAVKGGAYGFVTKPFVTNETLVMEVVNAGAHKRLRERSERLQRELADLRPGAMVGSSAPMREMHRMIYGVAKSDATVLVLGESGTGKELVACAIHERSNRAHKALVAVNCGAMPKELVESELFGHARGAFTTAVSARAGLFEAANGGTLFLDEVGDLPAAAQVKLLRALESGEIKPVGSDSIKRVDVRVVAATNADLKAAIAAGTFRRDLFYRLNVVSIGVPPLRDRGDDILQLAQHFLQRYAERAARPTPRLTPEAAMCLMRHGWPGNVRELEHAMERALLLHEGDVVGTAALPAEIASHARAARPSVPATEQRAAPTEAAPRSVEQLVASLALHELTYADAKRRVMSDFTASYVAALLRATDGNVSEAARRSGLDRSNFRRLVRSVERRDDEAPSKDG